MDEPLRMTTGATAVLEPLANASLIAFSADFPASLPAAAGDTGTRAPPVEPVETLPLLFSLLPPEEEPPPPEEPPPEVGWLLITMTASP